MILNPVKNFRSCLTKREVRHAAQQNKNNGAP
jgi:hypothetical protein